VDPFLVSVDLQIGPLHGSHAALPIRIQGVNAVLGVETAARHLHVEARVVGESLVATALVLEEGKEGI